MIPAWGERRICGGCGKGKPAGQPCQHCGYQPGHQEERGRCLQCQSLLLAGDGGDEQYCERHKPRLEGTVAAGQISHRWRDSERRDQIALRGGWDADG